MQRTESQESLEVNCGDPELLTLHTKLLRFRKKEQPDFKELITFFKRYEILYKQANDYNRLTSLEQYLHPDLGILMKKFQLVHTDADNFLYHKLKTLLLVRPIAEPVFQVVEQNSLIIPSPTPSPQIKRARFNPSRQFSDFDLTESSCTSSSSDDDSVGSIADFVVSDSSSQSTDDEYLPPKVGDITSSDESRSSSD